MFRERKTGSFGCMSICRNTSEELSVLFRFLFAIIRSSWCIRLTPNVAGILMIVNYSGNRHFFRLSSIINKASRTKPISIETDMIVSMLRFNSQVNSFKQQDLPPRLSCKRTRARKVTTKWTEIERNELT